MSLPSTEFCKIIMLREIKPHIKFRCGKWLVETKQNKGNVIRLNWAAYSFTQRLNQLERMTNEQ